MSATRLPARGLSTPPYQMQKARQARLAARLAPMELRDHWDTYLAFAICFTVSTCSRDTQRRNDGARNNAGELHDIYVARTSRSNCSVLDHTYLAPPV
jgi:hypothetical protein